MCLPRKLQQTVTVIPRKSSHHTFMPKFESSAAQHIWDKMKITLLLKLLRGTNHGFFLLFLNKIAWCRNTLWRYTHKARQGLPPSSFEQFMEIKLLKFLIHNKSYSLQLWSHNHDHVNIWPPIFTHFVLSNLWQNLHFWLNYPFKRLQLANFKIIYIQTS